MRTDGAGAAPPAATDPASWLDDFFESYYLHRPVNATFIGRHEHDAALPDFSESGVGDTLADATHLLERCPDPDDPALSWLASIDVRVARGFLRTQRWELESGHFQGGNPSTYLGEAIFGVLGLFLTSFAPIERRVESSVRRMEAIPGLLDQARANVRAAPRPWLERALRECRGSLAFLTGGVDLLIETERLADPGLRDAADRAAGAIHAFEAHLRQLPTGGVYASGPEAFADYLREGHFLHQTPEELLRYAESQLEEATARLHEAAAALGDRSPDAALDRLTSLHPTVREYYGRYQAVWDDQRALAETHDLLTWPEFPIQYVPRPAWVRAAAPDLYFLFYRSPAAYNRPPVHEYLVTPIEPDMPAPERIALLRSNNDSVIKLNHVIHHGGIGHHVQNWHALRSESRVGRIAAVDCASRIAMFSGGTMAEGWACYATDLMSEVGGLTPLEQIAELQARRRMCSRTIVDVEVHHGRMTLDGAAGFYRENAGMSAVASHREAVKNSMFPGAAVMYLTGTDAIHALRRDLGGTLGSAFELRAFHDELLAYGSLPVSLVADDMRRRHGAAQ